MQIEKEKKSRNPNPNPNPRGKGTPDLLGLCVTHGRTCAGRMSAALAKRALHSKQPLAVRDAGGTSARARGLRAPPPGRSTAARSRTGGARAPARGPTAAPATLLPSRHGRSGRRCVAWREKGEGESDLGFRGRSPAPLFCSGGRAGRPSDLIRRPTAAER